jgi:hypothetical protein
LNNLVQQYNPPLPDGVTEVKTTFDEKRLLISSVNTHTGKLNIQVGKWYRSAPDEVLYACIRVGLMMAEHPLVRGTDEASTIHRWMFSDAGRSAALRGYREDRGEGIQLTADYIKSYKQLVDWGYTTQDPYLTFYWTTGDCVEICPVGRAVAVPLSWEKDSLRIQSCLYMALAHMMKYRLKRMGIQNPIRNISDDELIRHAPFGEKAWKRIWGSDGYREELF